MRRNGSVAVILTLLLFDALVDALLSVNVVGVTTTVTFHQPTIDPPLPFQFPGSSLHHASMVSSADPSSSRSSLHASSDEKSVATNETANSKKRSMYSFSEARKIARGHGFGSQQEFLDYACPGAYQLPKNANEVWNEDWTSWKDFLGVPLEFDEAREVARERVGPSSETVWKVSTEAEYKELMEQKVIGEGDIASRLPYRPDLKYKTNGWVSWEDFLQEPSPGE